MVPGGRCDLGEAQEGGLGLEFGAHEWLEVLARPAGWIYEAKEGQPSVRVPGACRGVHVLVRAIGCGDCDITAATLCHDCWAWSLAIRRIRGPLMVGNWIRWL